MLSKRKSIAQFYTFFVCILLHSIAKGFLYVYNDHTVVYIIIFIVQIEFWYFNQNFVTDSGFIKSRISSSWPEAQEQCNLFGGRLATIEDMKTFQQWLKTKDADYVLEDMTELWIAATLKRGVWKWAGNSNQVFNGKMLNIKLAFNKI